MFNILCNYFYKNNWFENVEKCRSRHIRRVGKAMRSGIN